MAAPLQLTDVAHGEQKGWRRSQHLVDSLPYVDGLTPQEKAAVDKMIEEEVRDRGAAALRRPGAPSAVASGRPKPSASRNGLPPLPETRFKVRSSHAPARRHSALPLHLLGPCSACA